MPGGVAGVPPIMEAPYADFVLPPGWRMSTKKGAIGALGL